MATVQISRFAEGGGAQGFGNMSFAEDFFAGVVWKFAFARSSMRSGCNSFSDFKGDAAPVASWAMMRLK